MSSIDTLMTSVNQKIQEISLSDFEKDLSTEMIQLNYLIGSPLLTQQKLKSPNTTITSFEIKLDEIFQLEDVQNKLEILEMQFKLDRTIYLPSISLLANIGTGFSTNNKDYTLASTPIIPYSTQIQHNAYQGLGFNLSIPIFNKGEWMKKYKIYEISKEENEQLKAKTILELEKRKSEISILIMNLAETLEIQKSILKDKETILEVTKLLYLEGKIRLDEVEKVQTEFYNYQQTVQEIELELMKLGLYRI